MKKTVIRLMAGVGLLVFSMSMLGAVSLSIAPYSISNSSPATVSFTISGITNGETVFLDRYLGIYSNQVIIPPLTARYQLTDSVRVGVGGVPNTSVPSDMDSARNGQVTVRLPFQTLDEAGRIAGTNRFRVSSPSGRFTPVETLMIVTQAPLSLTVTGTVFTVSKPETNAVVTLLDLRNEFVSGTVADLKGNYKLSVAPGEYRLVACAPGRSSVGTFVRLSVFNVVATQKLNLTNSPSTRVISGLLRNGTTGGGLPGTMLWLFSTNNEAVMAFSDSTGAFSALVTPGIWTVVPSELRLSQLDCNANCAPIVLDATIANVSTNIDFAAATSLVFGALIGTDGTILSGIAMEGVSDSTQASVVTDTNGLFATGVAPDAAWYWQPDPFALGRIGYLSPTSLFDIPDNFAMPVNIAVPPSTARIQGVILLDDGTPVGDLPLTASSFDGLSSAVVTKPDGTFDTGACAGDWTLSGDPSQLTARALLEPAYYDYSLCDGAITNVEIVLRRITSTLTVRLHDTDFQPIPFVPVSCAATIGGDYFAVNGTTDQSGQCVFDLCDGTWTVETENLEMFGFASPIPQDATVSSSNGTMDFVASPMTPLTIDTTALPVAIVGEPYDFQLQAEGGVWPYVWAITAGDLPLGLSLDWMTGDISGTVSSSTNVNFTVTVQDNSIQSIWVSQDLSLVAAYPIHVSGVPDPASHNLQLYLNGEMNRSYIVEASTNAAGPWQALFTNTLTNPDSVFCTLPDTNTATFYRARMDF